MKARHNQNTGAASENESSAATTEEDSAEAGSEAETDGDGTPRENPCRVFFSYRNTERVAEVIADTTGGELFELEPVDPYTDEDLNYNDDNSRVSQEYADESLRNVELVADTVDDWQDVERIYIGYPVWWGIAAWPINTFVEANDFTGKTVIPFCTSASSGLGDSGELLAQLALNMSNEQLLDNLGLLEHGKLKRAAILLFHRNPEKWVTGAYIKIGYFGEGSDLRYQDEIHGSLFIQADRVIELIYLKYMKAMISYDNVTRIETYPLPKAAVREAVYNAIIHSNYAALVPIQIRIHEDAVYISNDCIFPVGWTVETLMERHRSQPYNPNIANGFFRAGYVETWGRGIEKICEACKKHGVPMPEYTLHLEDIMVKFTPLGHQDILKDQNVLINVPLNVLINDPLEKEVLSAIEENSHITQAQLSTKLNRSDRQIRRVLKELREKGIIERIGSRKSGQWIVK